MFSDREILLKLITRKEQAGSNCIEGAGSAVVGETFGIDRNSKKVFDRVFVFATICFCVTLQLFGKAVLWLATLFAWVVPLLAAGIFFLAENTVGGIYLTSPSAYGALFNSLTFLLADADYRNIQHLKMAFWIWIGSHALIALVLVAVLRAKQRRLRQFVLSEGHHE